MSSAADAPLAGEPGDQELGSEDALLRRIGARLAPLERERPWPQGSLGPGDDAALVPSTARGVLVSTDAMGEGTDFLREWPAGVHTRGHDVGFKAAAQNLSDINAMGGDASALVCALSVPPTLSAHWVAGVAGGMVAAVRGLGAHWCRVAGGDLGSAEQIQLTLTALGDPSERGVLTRRVDPRLAPRWRHDGALLVHAGSGPGWAAAGLALLLTPRTTLQRRWDALPALDRPTARELVRAVRAQLRPRPPLHLGPTAVGRLAALMDVSDGIGRDGARLAAANDASVWVDPAWVSTQAAALNRVAALCQADPSAWVLGGGEDYGLLGIAAGHDDVPEGFEVIGAIHSATQTPDAAARHGHDGRVVRLESSGWDHFTQD
ncbi:MAG: AIR synthase related protein [Micrococcus sp.]|nr:AIR synthase related protein [Micrococcus sp.]